jgi:hypothetical protein
MGVRVSRIKDLGVGCWEDWFWGSHKLWNDLIEVYEKLVRKYRVSMG